MSKVTLAKSSLSKDLLDLVTQYALFDELKNFNPDHVQSDGMHCKYADPLMESILLKIKPEIESIVNKKLGPTYSYYRVYRDGSILEKHIDRNECEISATLNFGQNLESNWPIWMGNEKIEIEPGFFAIYDGCEIEHWRDRLSCQRGGYLVQGFFHYIDLDGPNKNLIFDGRRGIGYPPLGKKYIIYT